MFTLLKKTKNEKLPPIHNIEQLLSVVYEVFVLASAFLSADKYGGPENPTISY